MLWGCVLTEQKPFTFTKASKWNLVNITNAALSRSSSEGKTYLILTKGKETLTLAVLQKDKVENYHLMLKVLCGPEVKLSVIGKGEVHITGYLEPTGIDDSEDEDDIEVQGKAIEEFEDSEESEEEPAVIQKPMKDIAPKKIEKKQEVKKHEQKNMEKKNIEQKEPQPKKADTKKEEHKKQETRKEGHKKQKEPKKQEIKKVDQRKQEQKKPKVEEEDLESSDSNKVIDNLFEGLNGSSDEEDSDVEPKQSLKPSKQAEKQPTGKKREPEKVAIEPKKKHKPEVEPGKPKEGKKKK